MARKGGKGLVAAKTTAAANKDKKRPTSRSSRAGTQVIRNTEVPNFGQRTTRIRQLPKLASVNQLELRVEGYGDASILPLTLVIEACPCLRSFVLELTDPRDMLCRQRELERVVRPPHRYLKEAEFYNYYGRPCDLELVNYLVENAIALEKLVVNPCDEEEGPDDELKKVTEPRERALRQLKGKLPSKIDLVIN